MTMRASHIICFLRILLSLGTSAFLIAPHSPRSLLAAHVAQSGQPANNAAISKKGVDECKERREEDMYAVSAAIAVCGKAAEWQKALDLFHTVKNPDRILYHADS